MSSPTYLTKEMFMQEGGRLQIDFGNYDDFDNFATEIERKYLTKLWGVHNRDSYTMTGLSWTDGTSYFEVHGHEDMLKAFFYFHYITECQGAKVLSGSAEEAYQVAVNGTKDLITSNVIKAYNQGVDYFNEIVDYVNYQNSQDPTNYPDFNTSRITEKLNIFGI
jgi:hypothetical protein